MLFSKNKKAEVTFRFSNSYMSGTKKTVPLNEGKLLDFLKSQMDVHGHLIIEGISDENHISLTSVERQSKINQESRIDEINRLIHDYIEGKPLRDNIFVVLANGELKGLFLDKHLADHKREKLIEDGIGEDKIVIKEGKLNDFGE